MMIRRFMVRLSAARKAAGILAAKLGMVCALATVCSSGAFAQTAPAQPPLITVRYQNSIESVITLPILAAIVKDYFRAEGVDLVYQPLIINAAMLTNNLLNGGTDISLQGSFGNLTAVQAGVPVIAIALISAPPNQVIILNNKTVAELKAKGFTPQSPVAERLKALKGLTLAVFGSGSSAHQALTGILKQGGINPETDLTLQGINDFSALYSTVKQGAVDGAFFSDPLVSQAIREGFATAWISVPAGDVPGLLGVPWTELATTRDYIKNNPEALRRFLKAVWRGVRELQTNGKDPALRAAIKAKYFPKIDNDTFNLAFDNSLPTFNSVPVPTREAFDREVRFYNLSAKVPFTKTFADVYDDGPINKAKP